MMFATYLLMYSSLQLLWKVYYYHFPINTKFLGVYSTLFVIFLAKRLNNTELPYANIPILKNSFCHKLNGKNHPANTPLFKHVCLPLFFRFQEKPPPKPLWVIPLEIALNRYYYHDDLPLLY